MLISQDLRERLIRLVCTVDHESEHAVTLCFPEAAYGPFMVNAVLLVQNEAILQGLTLHSFDTAQRPEDRRTFRVILTFWARR